MSLKANLQYIWAQTVFTMNHYLSLCWTLTSSEEISDRLSSVCLYQAPYFTFISQRSFFFSYHFLPVPSVIKNHMTSHHRGKWVCFFPPYTNASFIVDTLSCHHKLMPSVSWGDFPLACSQDASCRYLPMTCSCLRFLAFNSFSSPFSLNAWPGLCGAFIGLFRKL